MNININALGTDFPLHHRLRGQVFQCLTSFWTSNRHVTRRRKSAAAARWRRR